MNIQEKVKELIESDDSFNTHCENKIKDKYINANRDEKESIDSIFIHLTGYSLGTIISCELNEIYSDEELTGKTE